jgi:hypothetical protein
VSSLHKSTEAREGGWCLLLQEGASWSGSRLQVKVTLKEELCNVAGMVTCSRWSHGLYRAHKQTGCYCQLHWTQETDCLACEAAPTPWLGPLSAYSAQHLSQSQQDQVPGALKPPAYKHEHICRALATFLSLCHLDVVLGLHSK